MQTPRLRGLFAYPSNPRAIGQIVSAAIPIINEATHLTLEAWEKVDNWGRPLVEPILGKISAYDLLIADITRLNSNVMFEVGFAIGCRKRVLLVINSGFETDEQHFKELGIYDTLGYKKYENAEQLVSLFSLPIDPNPLHFSPLRDTNAPIFILEKPARTDDTGRIISRVKRSRLRFRSFVPAEEERLPAVYAIEQVARSVSLAIPLCSRDERDANKHNLRAAFLAGLGWGMNRYVLLLNPLDSPPPLDVRDLVTNFRDLDQIDDAVNEIIFKTYDYLSHRAPERAEDTTILSNLSVGDPFAENEMTTLGNYYVRTDEFARARRGEVNLVVGRKGTGKTALWIQLRDDVRRNTSNVVVDLRPEGYQLVKLKEEVLSYLSAGARSHLITAFWEYLLYMELAYKLLEKDAERYLRDAALYEKYLSLQRVFNADAAFQGEGDFLERLRSVAERLISAYKSQFGLEGGRLLSTGEVTELLYSQHLRELRESIVNYLLEKEEVWILFDNLDKGWASYGLAGEDVFILRCLIDAGRKIKNDVGRAFGSFFVVIFVRNDIYQILMDETPDFGKEMRASLDWTDIEALKHLLARRIKFFRHDEQSFERVWNEICVPTFKGLSTLEYFIELSLMRPRNLLKIFGYCRGAAVNREKSRIGEEEIERGISSYSNDVLVDFSNEIRDLCPEAKDVLYNFIDEKREYRHSELVKLVNKHGVDETKVSLTIEYMLYYGIIGVVPPGGEPLYIFGVGYDQKKLKAMAGKVTDARYCLHPSLYPALGIRW